MNICDSQRLFFYNNPLQRPTGKEGFRLKRGFKPSFVPCHLSTSLKQITCSILYTKTLMVFDPPVRILRSIVGRRILKLTVYIHPILIHFSPHIFRRRSHFRMVSRNKNAWFELRDNLKGVKVCTCDSNLKREE